MELGDSPYFRCRRLHRTLVELVRHGGDKTRCFNHIRGWLDIEGTPQLDELREIIDKAPGQWGMKPLSMYEKADGRYDS